MIYNITLSINSTMNDVLFKLNANPTTLTVFIEDKKVIVGTVTDGDVRRALIKGLKKESPVSEFMNTSFIKLNRGQYKKEKITEIKQKNIAIVPVLNEDGTLHEFINFNNLKTLLPVDAVIMAGGVGSRLMPLTQDIPKPMLEIGGKPIIEYNLNLLLSYGINNINISVNYLADVIKDYYKDGKEKGINLKYVDETTPLGTIGAVKKIETFYNDYVLVMNSDLLTNINLESMFNTLIDNNADMVVATTDYQVQVPYGVVESNGEVITALKEKPIYTYYSNAGIYIIKKDMIDLIPDSKFFNATDLLECGINKNKKIIHFPINNYWLDIGKHHDFNKAQKDVLNLKF